jgi:hypothetical protein
VDHLHVNCFYDVNYEPEREMADLIRTTTYIQTAEEAGNRREDVTQGDELDGEILLRRCHATRSGFTSLANPNRECREA